MTKSSFAYKQLSGFTKSGGRKGARADLDKFIRKAVKHLDK